MSVKYFECAWATDIGRNRKNNEDACLCLPDQGVYCVADGIGGVAGGDLASEAITTNLQEVFKSCAAEECARLSGRVALFEKAANLASKWIKDFSDEKVIGQMGSTIVGLVLDPNHVAKAVSLHAGDSRLYRYRKGRLEQLTGDHSAVAALAAKLGRSVDSLPAKYQNELLRAVGLKDLVELERNEIEVASHDVFLLCSDGLTKMLPDKEIANLLKVLDKQPLELAVRTLIDRANEAGGKDNVTVVLVRVGDLSKATAMGPVANDQPGTQTIAAKVPPTIAAAAIVDGDRGLSGPTRDERRDSETPSTIQGATPATPSTSRTPPSDDATLGGTAHVVNPTAKRRAKPGKQLAVYLMVAFCGLTGLGWWLLHEKRQITPVPVTLANRATGEREAKAVEVTPETSRETSSPPVLVPNDRGGLFIDSVPKNVGVFRGDERLGFTPYSNSAYATGEYSLKLASATHSGIATGIVTWGVTVTNLVSLSWRSGDVLLLSDPTNAEVFEKDQIVGHTGGKISLPVGEHALRLHYQPLADRLVNVEVIADQTVQTNVAFDYGGLVVQSIPNGVEVFEGDTLIGPTPLMKGIWPIGKRELTVKKEGYAPYHLVVEIAAKVTNTFPVTLALGTGVLQLVGTVPGTRVWVDGNLLDGLPINVPVTAGVAHEVAGDYDGKRGTNHLLTVAMGREQSLVLRTAEEEMPPLPPIGTLAIDSTPAGVDVLFKGQRLGATPFLTNGFPAGQFEFALLSLTNAGRVKVDLAPGATFRTNVVLAQRMGWLKIASDPTSAIVWSGDTKLQKTPFLQSFPAGPIALRGTYEGLADCFSNHMVEADATNNLAINFKYGGLEVQGVPDGAQLILDKVEQGSLPYRKEILRPGMVKLEILKEGFYQTNQTVEIADHQTKLVQVVLTPKEEPKPVSLPPAKTFMVDGNSHWINNLGMEFVKVPNIDLWVAAKRVTKEDYDRLMSEKSNQSVDRFGVLAAVNMSYDQAVSFTETLTEQLKAKEPLPGEVRRYSLPTRSQYIAIARAYPSLKLTILDPFTGDWLLLEKDQGDKPFEARWDEKKAVVSADIIGGNTYRTNKARFTAIRLVIVP